MHNVVTLKVYTDDGGNYDKKWYVVKNAEDVLEMSICSGDTIRIKGLGDLEVYGVSYESAESGKNKYRSLIISCGIIT